MEQDFANSETELFTKESGEMVIPRDRVSYSATLTNLLRVVSKGGGSQMAK